MEEQRRVQEAEIGQNTDSKGNQTKFRNFYYYTSFFVLIKYYLIVIHLIVSNEMDVTRLTEAIQMSMSQQGESSNTLQSDTNNIEMKEELPATNEQSVKISRLDKS
jgi:hypothetical protein